MRRRTTGLLLALILLAFAVPATLGCCFGPPGGGPHPQHPAITSFSVRADAAEAVLESDTTAIHDCADHPAPAQTPYIETSNGGSSSGSATSRTANAADDVLVHASAATTHSVRRYGVAADDTGPPLWLSTCVSRT